MNVEEEANPTIIFFGKATDNKGVSTIQYSINGGVFHGPLPFSTFTFSPSADGKSGTFGCGLTPDNPGLNTVVFKSIDTRGNDSMLATRTFNYIVKRPLVVGKIGSGTLTSPFPGTDATKKVGFRYTLTAKPTAGYVFNGWTANNLTGTGITPAMQELPTLTFTHQEGLELTAHFIINPFTAEIIGKFNGLITPHETLPAPGGTVGNNETVGFLSGVTVQANGTFSGKLLQDGLSLPIGGTFDNTGVARFGPTRATTVTLARPTKPGLDVALSLDMTNTTHKLTGTVTQRLRGSISAVSNVDADRAFYSSTNRVSDTLAGTGSQTYTLVFKHLATQVGLATVDYPQSDGYATGSLKSDGTITFTGKLADHSTFSQTVPLSMANQWPLYAQLYSAKGCIAGLMTIKAALLDTDMTSGDVHWFRPYQSTQWYPWGWPEGITVDVIGARYTLPALPGLLTVDPLNGNTALIFTNGQLLAPLIENVNLSPTSIATLAPTTDKSFTFKLVPISGAISGTFTHSNRTKPAWQGVLFQKGANKGGYGYFMTVSPKIIDGAGQSGGIELLVK